MLDLPVQPVLDEAGRLIAFSTRRNGRTARHRVKRLLGEWPAPLGARLYRFQVVEDSERILIVEIVGAGLHGGWHLRDVWE